MGASMTTKTKSRGRRTGGSYRPMAEINVTPFVDVMLVLLIVFMVAAPLLTAGVPVDLPNSNAKPIADEDNRPIEVTVTKEGLIYIAETEVKKSNLINLLKAMSEQNDTRRIYVRGDENVSYGEVMGVIGSINAAGFSKVALISEK